MQTKISEYLLNTKNPAHHTIDFVNTTINRDIKLFIDPILIEIGTSAFCKKAKRITKDFFNKLHTAYYITNCEKEKKYLLMHAREINDTHLGYAKKYGKGNTEEGLFEIFHGIDDYVKNITISQAFEWVLFVPKFAEDGMSDLLTNILYKELSNFTISQCKKYNIQTEKCPDERYYWSDKTHSWKLYTGESLVIDGKIHLLVPKEIVQPHYRFTTDNFLRSVIVENICESKAWYDKKGKKSRPPKDKTRKEILKENGTIFETIRNFAIKDNSLLLQYQKVVNEKYKLQKMTNDEF